MIKKYLKWVILVCLILTVAYFNRWIFSFKFEPEYWENFYYTSQWNVANSQREIPDEGVYRYIGYRLVNGENPFNVDYWVPPMGKYWYGVGAKYLQNPYLVSFSFYLLSILIFGLLTKLIFKNHTQWLAIYLWTTNPLHVEQIGQTMLDLPLTLFFLTHIYFLFKYKENQSTMMLMLAGIFLGLMAGTKPAYFIPMIGLIDWWWIMTVEKNNKIRKLFLYLAFVIGGYVLAYTCYFVAHPNPVPWIRLHEKVINFQKGNSGSHDVMNIFKIIFLNKYKLSWFGGKEMFLTGWSFIFPLGTILLTKNIFFFKKIIKENSQILYLSLVSGGYILMCLNIDLWPRYLVPLIPLLILLVVNFFKNKNLILFLLLISYFPWLKFNFFPKPETVLVKWDEGLKRQQYHELYRLLDKNSQQKISEADFLIKLKDEKGSNLLKEPILENNQLRIKIN